MRQALFSEGAGHTRQLGGEAEKILGRCTAPGAGWEPTTPGGRMGGPGPLSMKQVIGCRRSFTPCCVDIIGGMATELCQGDARRSHSESALLLLLSSSASRTSIGIQNARQMGSLLAGVSRPGANRASFGCGHVLPPRRPSSCCKLAPRIPLCCPLPGWHLQQKKGT